MIRNLVRSRKCWKYLKQSKKTKTKSTNYVESISKILIYLMIKFNNLNSELPYQLFKEKYESALKIGPMKSVRPLETDKDATDNAQDDKSLPTPDETSS